MRDLPNYEDLPDEELLLLFRDGDMKASFALNKRYFDKRSSLARLASPSLSPFFSNWDLNYVFFGTFSLTVERYEFGKNSQFLTYFLTVFRHELIKEAERTNIFGRLSTLSLDEEIKSDLEGEGLPLGEIIAAPKEDPMRYVDYLDECISKNDAKNISQDAVDVARLHLSGYSFSKISSICGFSKNQCRYLYDKYLSYLREFVV